MNMTLDILCDIRNLLIEPDRWTKDYFARNARGEMTDSNDPSACSWCMSGAIHKVFHAKMGIRYPESGFYRPVRTAIQNVVEVVSNNSSIAISEYNDMPDTTHADIIKVLDKAIFNEMKVTL